MDVDQVPSQAQFQCWVDEAMKSHPQKIDATLSQLCIRIVDKKESEQLNQTYRHKNNPTNVLSFAYEDMPGMETESLGDIAICADIVSEEANTQHKSLQSHWAHLTVHGVLHLLGYDHGNEKDAEIMENLEINILRKLGFSNPYYVSSKENISNA